MIQFFAYGFAIAGLAAASGPFIIHLLNRRRYRVVDWAAMDFLREALERNRKILELRDIILLILRTVCVLLVGFALARPFFSSGGSVAWALGGLAIGAGLIGGLALWNATKKTGLAVAAAAGGVPIAFLVLGLVYGVVFAPTGAVVAQMEEAVHAVLLVDNSLSMGYSRLDGTLLDEAREKAKAYIERLPRGSRINILPLCTSAGEFSRDPYRTKEDALEALNAIRIADRSASAPAAFDLAVDALGRATDVPAKRVVFLGDQQTLNWPPSGLSERLKDVPELQVVQVGPADAENTWISDFRLQDNIADTESQSEFIVRVSHKGQPRERVQIKLDVGGSISTSSIDLTEGQDREVRFPVHIEANARPGRPAYVVAKVSIPADDHDRLVEDNERFISVPVVAALPVVFVDQYGADEKPALNLYGETFRLRRLLAGVQSRTDQPKQLVQVRHVKLEELTQELLADARLAVIAGIDQPTPVAVKLLREYVQQGGQVVIAAGGKFNPAAWTKDAWLDGAGILPAPLANETVGEAPEEVADAKKLSIFRLEPKSMSNDYFLIDDEGRDDIFKGPFFFKTASANVSQPVLDALAKAETARVEESRRFKAESAENMKKWAEQERKGTLGQTEQELRKQEERRLTELEPNWLLWRPDRKELPPNLPAADVARMTLPLVLANYDNGLPYLIERQIGQGRVLLCTSGVQSSWNNLTKTYAVVIFERILRSMLEQTLPRRNRDADETISIAIDAAARRDRLTLTRPGGIEEPLTVEALGADVYGVTLRDVSRRGIYRVSAYSSTGQPAAPVSNPANVASGTDKTADPAKPDEKSGLLWEIPVAVNGSPEESDLDTLDANMLRTRLGDATKYRFVNRGEQISLEGATVRAQNLWKALMFLVLLGLLAEMATLLWPTLAAARQASAENGNGPGVGLQSVGLQSGAAQVAAQETRA